jgi:hypothetical protein
MDMEDLMHDQFESNVQVSLNILFIIKIIDFIVEKISCEKYVKILTIY